MLTRRLTSSNSAFPRPSLLSRAPFTVALFSLGSALVSVHCAGGDADPVPEGGGGSGSGPRDQSEIALGNEGAGTSIDDIKLNPLCGMGACVPDQAKACTSPEVDGYGGQGGGNFGGAAGGVNFDPGDLEELGSSCVVQVEADCKGEAGCSIVRSCAASGVAALGDPCVSAADCSAGLACVGEGLSGVCRPYCCRGTETSCDDQSFCDERRLLETPEVYVPVCLPLDRCALSDPFPCSADRNCSCQGDRACMVVRTDGSTACTIPGAGQAGDSCSDNETADCAHGYVCGPNQICMQICSTTSEISGCPEGSTCLKESVLGAELGICIAPSEGSAAAR